MLHAGISEDNKPGEEGGGRPDPVRGSVLCVVGVPAADVLPPVQWPEGRMARKTAWLKAAVKPGHHSSHASRNALRRVPLEGTPRARPAAVAAGA